MSVLQPLPPVFFFTVPLTNCQMSSTESTQLMPSFSRLYHIFRQHLSPLKFQPLSSLTLHMIYDFHPVLHFHLQFLLDPQLRLYLHLRLHLHLTIGSRLSFCYQCLHQFHFLIYILHTWLRSFRAVFRPSVNINDGCFI